LKVGAASKSSRTQCEQHRSLAGRVLSQFLLHAIPLFEMLQHRTQASIN